MIHQNNGKNDAANGESEQAGTEAPASSDSRAGSGKPQADATGAPSGLSAEDFAALELSPEDDVISRDVHLAAVEAETSELRDQLLRAVAEAQNIRKRAERDVAEARRFAIAAFVGDIVPLTDTFHRAIAAVPADAIEADPALKSLLDGVIMTERQFQNVLEKHGVKRIEPRGDLFDPNFHQAIAQFPNPEVPAGTITEVAQPGFKLGERVLRPAMVVVAQGGPKPEKTSLGQKDAAAPSGQGFDQRETPPPSKAEPSDIETGSSTADETPATPRAENDNGSR